MVVASKTHQPCPSCGSSDACTINTDGSWKCHSCGTFKPSNNKGEQQMSQTPPSPLYTDKGKVRDITDRKITEETCRKYDVKSIIKDGEIFQHIYPYCNEEGKLVAQKIRTCPTKQFNWVGRANEAVLFGQQLFPASGKYITVTEGELDALAVYQMQGSKFPVVSIPAGATSKKAIKDNYKYLDSFENIILCWDGDEPGVKAVREIAAILPPNKVKIVKMPGEKKLKDACDFLREGKAQEFINLWWRAEEFRPEGLVNLADMWDRIKEHNKNNTYIPTGIAGLDEKIIGFRDGQVIVTASGTGMGKTAVLRKILLNILGSTTVKVGTFFLEEITEDSAKSFLSNYLGVNLKNPTVWEGLDEAVIKQAFETLNDGRRIEMYDGFDCNNVENLERNIRYLVKARDCKVICIDHITMIVDDDDDVRRALNKLMRRLKNLAIELKIIVIAACHLRKSTGTKTHEEGGRVTLDDLKDSSSIKQLSDIIIGLERNQQADDDTEANTTKVRVLKNRDFGDNGLAAGLFYNKETTQFEEVSLINIDDEAF